MKTATLLRLGGLAMILAQVLNLINNLLYLFQSEQPPTVSRTLIILLGAVPLFTLGLVALYASVARRGGIVGLLAFLFLFLSSLSDMASWTLSLATAQGITTLEQINQVPFNAAASSVFGWIYWLGLLLLGYTVYRSGVYPRAAGVLLALIAPLSYFNGVSFVTPIFILFSFGVWVWLGWLLASGKVTMMEAD